MLRQAYRHLILLVYLVGIVQMLRIRAFFVVAGVLLCAFIAALICMNMNVLTKDKNGIIKYSLLYELMYFLYQMFTPSLGEMYRPYSPIYYHLFVAAGICFWIIGYKGYDIFQPFNKAVIACLMAGSLVYSFVLLFFLGGSEIVSSGSLSDDDMFYYLYQYIPYFLLWMTSGAMLLKRHLRAVVFASLAVTLMLSTKRGPLVSMGIGLLAIPLLQRKVSFKGMVLASFAAFACLWVVKMGLDTYLTLWTDRWTAKEDVSSGRDEIWQLLLNDFFNHDAIRMLFGNGYEASHVITYNHLRQGLGAHNDFVDTLYNFGILGLSVYVLLLVSWLRITLRAVKEGNRFASAMTYMLACFVVGSVVSSNVTRFTTIYFGVYFYYFAGIVASENRLRRKSGDSRSGSTQRTRIA